MILLSLLGYIHTWQLSTVKQKSQNDKTLNISKNILNVGDVLLDIREKHSVWKSTQVKNWFFLVTN